MNDLILWSGVFLASLAVLIKSSDFFTEAAEDLGLFLGIPSFVVGVTIVSLGTSLPELISSIYAVLNDSSEIVIGNVLGSNITNIFLVLGVAAVVGRKLEIKYELVNVDLPLLVGSALLLAAMLYNGQFSIYEAILCIAGYVLYTSYAIWGKKEETEDSDKSNRPSLEFKTPIILVMSAIFIYFSAKYTIDAVIKLSEIIQIGKAIIAASAISLGTSFPELMVSINAARKGKSEIAVGNVLGSNIFNAFAVMGIPGIIGNVMVPTGILTFGLPLLLISALVIATILYFFITQDKEITQWEGWLLLIFYFFFLGKLFEVF